jgi:hypothetical protein
MTISRSESSRINGSRSVGPVTEAGRARSSQNALRLGIYSNARFISGENPEDYAALVDELAAMFNPGSAVEWLYIDRMAMAEWRRARLDRGESAAIELARNRFLYASDHEKWERYGGRGLVARLSQISPETLASVTPERDKTITSSLCVSDDSEKFVRLAAALQRQFDTALRQLLEEQARRVGSIELARIASVRTPKVATAEEAQASEVVDR